jgi:plasmid stabilization system protein ParE
MRYTLTPEARSDLKGIAQYLAVEASIKRSITVITDLRDEFRKLGEMPGIGTLSGRVAWKGVSVLEFILLCHCRPMEAQAHSYYRHLAWSA